MEWELGISRGKLLYIEWINNKVLQYHTGNLVQYPVINHNGEEKKKALYLKHGPNVTPSAAFLFFYFFFFFFFFFGFTKVVDKILRSLNFTVRWLDILTHWKGFLPLN